MQDGPDPATFTAHYEAGKSQIVWRWAVADLETPVSAWLKLCHDQPYSFLLESVEGGAVLGRYSAIGLDPDFIWRYPGDGGGDPLADLKRQVNESRLDIAGDNLPPMAASGLFGYLGYGMIRLTENIPNANPDELGIPESILIRPTLMVIFDNVKSMICVSTPVREHKGNSHKNAREVYDQAVLRLEETLRKLSSPIPERLTHSETAITEPLTLTERTTAADYKQSVRRAVEYIRAGEIFQVVPSLRFSVPFDLPSIELYRALRRVNPSPFLFHLNFGDFAIVGSSPEIMVRVRKGTITIRPIAGTRKRGKTALEDKELADDLLNDPKERAEHLMLLDLARNDVGRVAEIGSVTVTDKFNIEHYSHVMHIVSNVEGRLRHDLNPLDALFAGFPAGTVSGAPKIRAMEIIDELEPVNRSFYGGCIGYLDGNGDVDTCIALRTALVKDGKIYMQAGAGVVADSDPESEYQECCNKARAIIDAAALAVRNSQLKRKAS